MMIKKQKHLARIKLTLLSFISLLIISACSAHPGAGTWKTETDNSLQLSKIVVTFEGTADLFSRQSETAIRRCFWSAAAENQLQLQCVHADNTGIKETYQLTIIEKDQAKLTMDDKLIALLRK
ncbi:MAG: hypothetical protein KZQ83_09860 [gamma proteobacterium symbiont of Taylorina sp.]|nr:hypothetical protein [gamma proteobacterium symbiont of Taylorina sp.]